MKFNFKRKFCEYFFFVYVWSDGIILREYSFNFYNLVL